MSKWVADFLADLAAQDGGQVSAAQADAVLAEIARLCVEQTNDRQRIAELERDVARADLAVVEAGAIEQSSALAEMAQELDAALAAERDELQRLLARPAAREIAGVITERDAARAEVARLREALEWYGRRAAECRLIHSGGDQGRADLAADGGKRASAALASKGDSA